MSAVTSEHGVDEAHSRRLMTLDWVDSLVGKLEALRRLPSRTGIATPACILHCHRPLAQPVEKPKTEYKTQRKEEEKTSLFNRNLSSGAGPARVMAVLQGRPLGGGPLGHGGWLTTPRNGTN